jgi:hypothetical protein
VRRRLLALGALALLGAAACSQTFDATSLGVPVTMSTPADAPPQGAPFRTTTHTVHAFFGLVTVSQANLQKSLARQLVGGQEVSRLRIHTRSRFLDLVITCLTFGVVVPRSVTYEGVIIGR